jgi:hypothetical protein
MNKPAQEYLHEHKVAVTKIQSSFTATGSITSADAEILYKFGYEYPLKAIVAQHRGSIPKSYQVHPLDDLVSKIGLTNHLPTDVRSGIEDLKGCYPAYPSEDAYRTLVSSSTAAEWRKRIEVAVQLGKFVEDHVLTTPSSVYPQLFHEVTKP